MDRLQEAAGTGIVDDNMQCTKGFYSRLHDTLYIFFHSHVSAAENGFSACFTDLLNDRFSAFDSASDQNYFHSVGGIDFRNRLTDT